MLWLVSICGLTMSGPACAAPTEAESLLQTYHALEDGLQRSPLKRTALLASSESAEHLSGDLHAVVAHSFLNLKAIATSPDRWCEIILLLSNTKACHVNGGSTINGAGAVTTLNVLASSSKTADTSGASTTDFQFVLRRVDPEYLNVELMAASGPMGTSDIQLQLQAVQLGASRTFLKLHYSYTTQWMGRVAMQAYLQTLGRGKIGFTRQAESDAWPQYIGGARGVIERNTMRYFLGLDCALASSGLEPPARFNEIASCWYGAVETYPAQLHEMQRTEYLPMKAAEYLRQAP
jgi:hypothetical protein